MDGSTSSSFGSRDCLIVHGNTERGGDSSINKNWGHYYCSSKFSAVICQLNIDVHGNGGLKTTSSPTTSTSTTQTSSESSSSSIQTSSVSSFTSFNATTSQIDSTSRIGRSLIHHIMAKNKMLHVIRKAHAISSTTETTTETTTDAIHFDTLQTLAVIDLTSQTSKKRAQVESTLSTGT